MGMNSFDTCLEVLKILPSKFNLNRCVCNLDTEGSEITQEQAQESFDTVIQVSQEDIEKKLETMFKKIEDQVCCDSVCTAVIWGLFIKLFMVSIV